ncbi:TlpA family protein disulfide reductase [Acidiferrimicrobium sp. IK]|uniref:TlpA family protein disulfide reductase n=1 Tax=Acidiferrimicrobium sp. IK TaxID=2871700 RepID=UPI0021CB8666|nr:TlpA disulfide reductase family protein [Acidiferrimicrobium sp. IK]MCU4185759.1 TlpA family protein disulfide reductase [Acidiferrimicrobium sp. IK]
MTDPEPRLAAPAPEPAPEPTRQRRGHRARWAALSVGLIVVGLVIVLAVQPSAANRQVQSPLVGNPAPPVAGPSVTPYPFTSLGALGGRWVLVNFFATWCVPCQVEQPELARFAAEHRASGDVQLVMVVYSDSTPNVRGFLAARGGDWPAVQDPGGQIALSYGVSGIPETYLVDPHGIIVAKIVGGSTTAGLDRLLAAAQARGL